MSLNLIDSAKSLFTNELVNKASSYLGESESGITKAISGIAPTIFSGLINKVSTHEGAAAVANMVSEQHTSGVLGNLESFFGNDGNNLLNKGGQLLSGLFGNKLDGITGLISSFSGLKSSSASSLLSMAASAILGLIGKHSTGGASGIASLLSSQKGNIALAMPSGLNLGGILGSAGSNVTNLVSDVKTTTFQNAVETKTNSSSPLRVLLPLFLLVLAVWGGWYFFGKGCNKGSETVADTADSLKNKTEQVATEAKTAVVAATGKLDSLSGEWIYDAGEMATIDLPNNAGKLTVGKNSTEYKLVNFLNDKNAVLDTAKGNWFEFTNVHFKKGGTELTDESMAQLKNMALIAKAYPAAKFKFGGYTDNTGSDAINIPLSQKRAEAVSNMVVKLGAPKEEILEAKGYGSQWPLQSNDTKPGQAQNRRVAVNVKAK